MNKKQILVWTGWHADDGLCRAIGGLGNILVERAENKSDALTKMAVSDALIVSNPLWDDDCSKVLADCPRLEWIQLINAGYDNLEKSGLPAGVVVSANGGAGAEVVAEHAVTLLLALLRAVPEILRSQSRQQWDFEKISGRVEMLHGKRVTIIGYGYNGRAIARLLSCFGAGITILARSPAGIDAAGLDKRPMEDMYPVLAETDVLIPAVPLTPETEFLIDAAAFSAMKPYGYLVNIARGRVVDTDALMEVLRAGKLAGAALDVADPEPLPGNHPLWKCPNIIISPHVAWAGGGDTVRKKVEDLILDNVQRFLNGDGVRNTVPVRNILNTV